LRWLDVSGTDISIKGVRSCLHLQRLEWLDVSNTRVGNTEIAEIQSKLPNAKIGFATSPTPTVASERQDLVRMAQTAAIASLWTSLRETPYSSNALEDYLTAIGHAREVDFPSWYISSVYRARRQSMESLLVIEINNGIRTKGYPGVFRSTLWLILSEMQQSPVRPQALNVSVARRKVLCFLFV
jgi:hypothetical protein